ncbi:MAG: aspartyl/asparaginyl beta-hydroxylase domain-containing protein [Sphingomonas sp.]
MDSLDSAQTPARLEAQGDRRAPPETWREHAACCARPPRSIRRGRRRGSSSPGSSARAATFPPRWRPSPKRSASSRSASFRLLLKATLLEALGRAEAAGETYGYALAQLPPDTPPAMAATVARAPCRACGACRAQVRPAGPAQEAAGAALDTRERARMERSAATSCGARGPIMPSRRTSIIRACANASTMIARNSPGCRARSRDRRDRRGLPPRHGLRARRAGALCPISRRRAAAAMGGTQPQPRLDRDPPDPETAGRSTRTRATAPRRWKCSRGSTRPDIPGRGPNAMFSLLAPGAHIPPHHGVSNARLVCHLPLIVPPGCWFRVRRRPPALGGGKGLGVRRHDRA